MTQDDSVIVEFFLKKRGDNNFQLRTLIWGLE